MYNINSARELRGNNEEVFIVEGYMDVINLHKFGIQNTVANLGTAMTERQIELVWKFFKNPILCLDGDDSGQKAALRAAERLYPLIKPNYNIYFLTLPKNLDPDSYINKHGKESFINLSKNKIEIQNFIWDSYIKNVDRSNPHALSLFEKKIKDICKEIKDKTLAKYFLNSFNEKINELTPNLNYNRRSFSKFEKIINPLQQTKEIFKQRDKFEEKQLKEFSIFYLIMNNLDIFRKNVEIISEINFDSEIMNDLKTKIINHLSEEKFFDRKNLNIEDFDKKFTNLINLINNNAPVKIICRNKNEYEIISIFHEIKNELKKIDLRKKIESLEHKVSTNLDEKLYSELLSLRNQLKSG